MQPNTILETALYITDLEAAEKFYTNVIGLKLNSKREGRHLFFNCGKGMLLIFNSEKSLVDEGVVPIHGSTGPGHIAFAINFEDFPQWKKRLQENNVEIEKEVNWGEDKYSLYFRDPGNNSIELTTPSIWNIS